MDDLCASNYKNLKTSYYLVYGPTVDAGNFLHISVLSSFTFWISPPFTPMTVAQRFVNLTPAGFLV